MPTWGGPSSAIGFAYLGSVSLVAAALVVVGCLLDVGGRASARVGPRFDDVVVALIARLLRPIDLVPPPRRATEQEPESSPSADGPL